MDQDLIEYFLSKFNGIKTLSLMNQEIIHITKSFQDFDKSKFYLEDFVMGDAAKKSPEIKDIFIRNLGKINV